MEIMTACRNGVLVALLIGKLDANGADELHVALEKEVDDDVRCIVLDMAKADELGKEGLDVCLRAAEKAKRAGGVLALSDVREECRAALASFEGAERLAVFDGYQQAVDYCENFLKEKGALETWDDIETLTYDFGGLKALPVSNDRAVLHLLGDAGNATPSDLWSKRVGKTEYSFGSGGLGDSADDLLPRIGATVTFGGAVGWQAVGKGTPFYAAPQRKDDVALRTCFNASLFGRFNELFCFDAESGVTLERLYRALCDAGRTRRSDYRGLLWLSLYGRIVSLDGTAGSDATCLSCGIVADPRSDMSLFHQGRLRALNGGDPASASSGVSRMHGLLFAPHPMPGRMANLAGETAVVLRGGDCRGVLRLPDDTVLTRGLVGVGYLQAVEEDPAGVPGVVPFAPKHS